MKVYKIAILFAQIHSINFGIRYCSMLWFLSLTAGYLFITFCTELYTHRVNS